MCPSPCKTNCCLLMPSCLPFSISTMKHKQHQQGFRKETSCTEHNFCTEGTVCWNVTTYSQVNMYRRFRGICPAY